MYWFMSNIVEIWQIYKYYVYGILQFKVPNIKGIVMEEK